MRAVLLRTQEPRAKSVTILALGSCVRRNTGVVEITHNRTNPSR